VFQVLTSYIHAEEVNIVPEALITGALASAGIMGADMATELARDLLFKVIEGVDKGKSSASMHPSVSYELSNAKKVAVLLGKTG
jgi:hypothetical protein